MTIRISAQRSQRPKRRPRRALIACPAVVAVLVVVVVGAVLASGDDEESAPSQALDELGCGAAGPRRPGRPTGARRPAPAQAQAARQAEIRTALTAAAEAQAIAEAQRLDEEERHRMIEAGIMFCPVDGPVDFVDSWGYARSGGRSHQGVDMLASTGIPTVAPSAATSSMRNPASAGSPGTSTATTATPITAPTSRATRTWG